MLNQRKLKKLCKTLASVFFFHTTTKAAHTIPCLREPPPLTIGTAQSNVTVFRQCQRLSRQRVFHKVRSWIKQSQMFVQKLLAKIKCKVFDSLHWLFSYSVHHARIPTDCRELSSLVRPWVTVTFWLVFGYFILLQSLSHDVWHE